MLVWARHGRYRSDIAAPSLDATTSGVDSERVGLYTP